MHYIGPVKPIEISNVGERKDKLIPITLKEGNLTILVRADLVDFKPGWAILPMWLYKRVLPYLKTDQA